MMKETTMSEVSEIKNNNIESNLEKFKSDKGTNIEEAKSYADNDIFQSNGKNDANTIYYDDNGNQYRVGDSLVPNVQYEINGYKYKTDNMGRIISAEGKLQVKDHQGRNEMPDSRDVVAHGKMAETDDRGHLIADRFNGGGDLGNLVPMEGKLNKGDYAKLEGTLGDAVNDGANVKLKVEPVYGDTSNRPTEFRVSYSIDGDKDVVVFKNRSDE